MLFQCTNYCIQLWPFVYVTCLQQTAEVIIAPIAVVSKLQCDTCFYNVFTNRRILRLNKTMPSHDKRPYRVKCLLEERCLHFINNYFIQLPYFTHVTAYRDGFFVILCSTWEFYNYYKQRHHILSDIFLNYCAVIFTN